MSFSVPQITIKVQPVIMMPPLLPLPTPSSPTSSSPPAEINEQCNRIVFTCANCDHTNLSWLDVKEEFIEHADENVYASEMLSVSDDYTEFTPNSPFNFFENEYENHYDRQNDLANINSIMNYLKAKIKEETD